MTGTSWPFSSGAVTAVVSAATVLLSAPAFSADTGREIFHGLGNQSGKARLGEGGFSVPVKHANCSGCHGRDALGYAEGGTSAPPVSSTALSRSTPARKGYDLTSFSKLLESGVDPSGRKLSSVMPRFDLKRGEVESLFGYLGIVEQEQRTGVNASTIRLGVPVPRTRAELASHIIARFESSWRQIGAGFIHGRSLQLVAVPYDPADPQIDRHLEASAVAALVFSPADPEGELRAAAARLAIPFLLPFFALEGTESFRDVRSILATRRDALHAVLKAAPPDAEIVADDRYAALVRALDLAEGRRVIRLREATKAPSTFIALVNREELQSLASLELAGRTVYALLDDLAPMMREFTVSGATLWVADQRLRGGSNTQLDPLDQFLGAASRVLHSAVLSAGRDLTRDRLIRAFDQVRITPEAWHELDFTRRRLTGTQAVHVVQVLSPDRKPAK